MDKPIKQYKRSTRFYNDHEVRAIWDEEHSIWWFSAVDIVAAITPSKNTKDFLDWFTYSDNTIDGRSRKKAYTFMESNLIENKDVGTVKALQQIHGYIFGGLYDFAGKIRTKTISKGNFIFCLAE